MLKQAWRKPDPELGGKMSARSVEAKPCGSRAQARLWGPDARDVWKRDHMSSLCFLEKSHQGYTLCKAVCACVNMSLLI